ncbi:SYA [Enterospora canceri]|uniref:Alanine--tRNA ligase n=1 Tax=Enterospora canceri TaxID=1081671 RepID=A0A1Y1S8C9_9MICR|nr:SYA [Enterospora canceri]
MVQFKQIFLGEKPEYKRVITVQHCIRAGGKHNDLEDVGKDNYHHTFFEMMGNWSFGDYFKEEAIKYAFEFLTEVCNLNTERLYVTVYDEMDKESRAIWKKYLPESRIVSAGQKDNFWEMGEFGPCGPCTEIHYDRIGGRDASALVNQDDPNVLEIWNIVFMEFNRTPHGLIDLDVKKIDTGIGLERLLSILMEVKSNYQIDTFIEIIKSTEEETCGEKYDDLGTTNKTVAFRVVADHARTLAICLYYGVSFGNEGIGYVLRRILRRAVRFASEVLQIRENSLSKIVQKAADCLELGQVDVSQIDAEENMFKQTLKKGILQFDKLVKDNRLTSESVFKLYDTYGFPRDLTELMAQEKGVICETKDFEKHLQEQKERSKTKKETPITIELQFDGTDDSFKYDEKQVELDAKLLVCIKENELVEFDKAESGETYQLIFNRTNMYGECGGQVGDTGTIEFIKENKKVGEFTVVDTKILRNYIVHYGKLEGVVTEKVVIRRDQERRMKIRNNHSTCHILGDLVTVYIDEDAEQQGSYVDEFKCTYDFNYSGKITDEKLKVLEDAVNEFIKSNSPVEVLSMSKKEVAENNVHLMPNVKYPDPLRIIKMTHVNGMVFMEPCGGTHISKSSMIRKVRIVSEAAVSGGRRRIICVSGELADECDLNADEAKKSIENGTLARLEDKQMSVYMKRRLTVLNRDLIRKKNKAITERISTLVEETQNEILLNKLNSINTKTNKVILKEIDELKTDKKTQVKAMALVCECFAKKEMDAFVTMKVGEEVLVAAFRKNGKEIYKKIAEKYEKMRVSRDMLQGTLLQNKLSNFKSEVFE